VNSDNTPKTAPPIYNSDSSTESNKTGLIVGVIGIFAVIFGIGLYTWVRDMRRDQLENPETGIGYPNDFKHLNTAPSSTRIGIKTIDFDKLKMDISAKILTAARASFNFMKNTLSRNMKSFKRNGKYVPRPINMDDYMRAVGYDWPSKNDQAYRPPPGSLIADGNEQYYKVGNDGFAYPIDTMGKVIKPENSVVEELDAEDYMNSVIKPYLSSGSRNTEGLAYSVVEDLDECFYPNNDQSTIYATGSVYPQSSMHNQHPTNSNLRPYNTSVSNRNNGYAYSVDSLRSASIKPPIIVQVEKDQDQISYQSDKYESFDHRRFGYNPPSTSTSQLNITSLDQ
jgi:hypothetical protein